MEKNYYVGHIYGARISKSGKWLNLTITTDVNGGKFFITCPVKIEDDYDDIAGAEKPYARLEWTCDSEGNRSIDKARVCNLRVYEDSKPKQEEAKADEAKADDLPF